MPESTAPPPLALDIEHTGDTYLVHCHGKLIAGTSELFYNRIKELIPGTTKIVLNLADLSRMDSTGLGALVRLYVSAKHVGCTIELTQIGKQIRELLGLTHLLSAFAVIGESGLRMG